MVASSAGEAQANFGLPFTAEGLENFVRKVVQLIGGARRNVRRIASPERRLLEDFGGRLFQAVFSGAVRECLARSRLAAESRDAGLRIRLRLPGALANIPWEYLYDAEYDFLGLSPETALVRYVEMPVPVRPFPVSPPLRILAMISAPGDVPGLQGEEEWGKLNHALEALISSGLVQVDRLEAGTLAALQRPLRLGEYHVLHFIGHGGYDEDAQDGALALEGTNRRTRLVTGRDLGRMIRGHRSLRLVVLNACEGARSAPDDPFGGVAQVHHHRLPVSPAQAVAAVQRAIITAQDNGAPRNRAASAEPLAELGAGDEPAVARAVVDVVTCRAAPSPAAAVVAWAGGLVEPRQLAKALAVSGQDPSDDDPDLARPADDRLLVMRLADAASPRLRRAASELPALVRGEMAAAVVAAALAIARRFECGAAGHPLTVAAAIELALPRLERDARAAAGLLQLLACPERVPLGLLLADADVAGALDRDVVAVIGPLLGDALATGDAVAALRRYSRIWAAATAWASRCTSTLPSSATVARHGRTAPRPRCGHARLRPPPAWAAAGPVRYLQRCGHHWPLMAAAPARRLCGCRAWLSRCGAWRGPWATRASGCTSGPW